METTFGIADAHTVAKVVVVEGFTVFAGKEWAMGLRICKRNQLDTMNSVDQRHHHNYGVVRSYVHETSTNML